MISVDSEPCWAAPPMAPAESAGPAALEPEASGAPDGAVPATGAFGELPEAWFHAHFGRLWRLVARLGVAGTSVDDVVQEAFIAAARRRADIAPGREWSFLVGAAVRLGKAGGNPLDRRRHRARAENLQAIGHDVGASGRGRCARRGMRPQSVKRGCKGGWLRKGDDLERGMTWKNFAI